MLMIMQPSYMQLSVVFMYLLQGPLPKNLLAFPHLLLNMDPRQPLNAPPVPHIRQDQNTSRPAPSRDSRSRSTKIIVCAVLKLLYTDKKQLRRGKLGARAQHSDPYLRT
jgi:hypothetical protein